MVELAKNILTLTKTSFVTDLEPSYARSAPTLHRAVKEAQAAKNAGKPRLPAYSYPPEVLTVSDLGRYSDAGVEFAVAEGECCPLTWMDAQRSKGKALFGTGLLMCEREAAECKAAERKAVHVWELSERERKIVEMMGLMTGETGLMTGETDEERAVMALMHEGYAPSEIDGRLDMPEGTARRHVVNRWARDKAEGTARKRADVPLD